MKDQKPLVILLIVALAGFLSAGLLGFYSFIKKA